MTHVPNPVPMGVPSPVSAATTVGVAVAVPDPFGAELGAWRARFGDPLADAVPPHVTILPPTELPGVTLRDVVTHLQSAVLGIGAFVMRLSGTGTFRPVSPVTFVEVVDGGGECDRLQKLVRTGILDRELKYDYYPHVTVAQDLDEPVLDEAQQTLSGWACEFEVDHLTVYLHRDGVWRPADRVDLVIG